MRYPLLLLLWLITDLALFVKAFVLAYFLRVGFIFSSDFPFEPFVMTAITVAPLWLLVLATTRTFHFTRNQMTLRNGAYIAYASLVAVALFTLAYYFRYSGFFSRLLLVEAFVITTLATWVWHIIFQHILRYALRRNPPAFPTLIVGVTRESKRLIELLNKHNNPLKPVAVLDGRGVSEKEIDGVPVIGKLNKLEETLEEYGITHLIQASDLEQSMNLLSACRQKGITYALLPSVLGIVERDEHVESLEGHPVTMVSPRKPKWMWFFA
jgi:FlaA1/EpsC-like NDP-sugar epimerase